MLLIFTCESLGISNVQKGPPPGFIIQFRGRVLKGERRSKSDLEKKLAFQLLIFPFDRNFYR